MYSDYSRTFTQLIMNLETLGVLKFLDLNMKAALRKMSVQLKLSTIDSDDVGLYKQFS